MRMSHRFLARALTLAAALLGMAATAHAQTVISSLPYTISASGAYVLNSDLNSSQAAGYLIKVNASNVTIDFQNHYISGPVGNTNQTTDGVYANERSNVTVKNGTIAYCRQGIALIGNGKATTNAVGEQVDNMRVTYCYQVGINLTECVASRITNCQVSQMGYSGASPVYGIFAYDGGVNVQGNVLSNATGASPTGIYAQGSFARQNTVSNFSTGIDGGKYQDNLTQNCALNVSGGTDAGGNN